LHHWRNFSGDADLERMERLVLDAYADVGPNFECAVGDLAWRLHRASTVRPEANIRLWQDDYAGNLIGFAWFIPNGDLELVVYPRAWCTAIVPDMLTWGGDRLQAPGATDRPGRALVAWSLQSNSPLNCALTQSGLVPNGHTYLHLARPLSAELVVRPTVPRGYSLREIGGPGEAAPRAALHRAAFPHSHITPEGYARMMTTRHYRTGLDIVAVSPQGDFAAMALAWFDAENKTGELEPVGTHPNHRRKNLARATCEEAMRRLWALGAETVVVYAEAENIPSVSLYRGLGFAIVDTNRGFARPV
jgi:GNAT superfamily N-acetyltransferase